MGRSLLPVVLVALLGATLGGCLTPDEAPDDAPTDATDPRRAAGTYVPWTVSDFWVYDMQVRGLDRYSETKLVYYEESGPEFVVGTPRHEEALYHAVFSVNPLLGRIHKEHLSPHERGEHAEMFPFENGAIQDGQVWTTVFYERQLRMRSTYDVGISTPGGELPGYRIHGDSTNGDLMVDYTYVPNAKWFTEMRVVDETGQLLHLRLAKSGTGYSGDAHFIRAKDLFQDQVSGSGITPVTRTFQVSAGDVDGHRVESFAISSDVRLESGINANLRVLDPDGNIIYERAYDDPSDGEFDIHQVWPTGADTTGQPLGSRPQWPAGTYTVRLSMSGTASADVMIVGTQDNSGSV